MVQSLWFRQGSRRNFRCLVGSSQFSLHYCKMPFFRRILIPRFPYFENSLHFNFADFPVNFIKQFVSCFFWCLKQMLLSKFVRYYCSHNIVTRILHIITRKSWYGTHADKIMVMGNSKNLCVFNFAILLKSRKFDSREIYMFYINFSRQYRAIVWNKMFMLNAGFGQLPCLRGFAPDPKGEFTALPDSLALASLFRWAGTRM